LVLGKSLPLGQEQSLPIGGLQLVNELTHARAEIGEVGGSLRCEVNVLGQPVIWAPLAKMIGNCVTNDPPDPGFQTLAGANGWQLLMDFDENILKDVVRFRMIMHTRADE